MPHASLEGLTEAQIRAVVHRGGPLLVRGGAGAGKSEILVRRLCWLAEQGTEPHRVLVLAPDRGGAAALRARIETALSGPYEELCVHDVREFCARLLTDWARAAKLDPLWARASQADRVAMLLERGAELELELHDFRGRPATLAAGFVRRIDTLKDELIDAAAFADWADGPDVSALEREFAGVWSAHDRMLAERGVLDDGDLLLFAVRLLRERADVCEQTTARWRELLIDDWQQLAPGEREVVRLLGAGGATVSATGDGAQALRGPRAANELERFGERHPGAEVVELDQSLRCPERVLAAAAAVLGDGAPATARQIDGGAGGAVRFWRCANERTEAQSVAAELERLIGVERVEPARLAVLVRSVAHEGGAVAVALQERAVPFRIVGADAFFERAEVRDVIAWLRLLVDPRDAGAAVRALSRAPIGLNSIDIARCIQIARRRKLDMLAALVAATESPQLPPEARDRVLSFLRLHRSATAALDSARPDLFVHRLIDRLGLRRQQLFTAQADVVERLVNLAKLGELAATFARNAPQATPREFARYVAAIADAGLGEEEAAAPSPAGTVSVMSMGRARGLEFDHVFVLGLHSARMPGARSDAVSPPPPDLIAADVVAESRATHVAAMRSVLHVALTRARQSVTLAYAASSDRATRQLPSPFAEAARTALGAEWEDREEELFGPAEALHAMYKAARDELLASVARIGGRIGELRLDTDLDITHGAVRFLELVKLAALLERPDGQTLSDALPDINTRLSQAATPLQREILASSPLDEQLRGAELTERGRAAASAARAEPSLEPFLPRRGEGLMLSASDIDAYRTCPLRYKFARVLRIPQEPTLNQRFGILVHQVLERFHATGGQSRDEMLGLLDAGWRRGGFSNSDEERQLQVKARTALLRYHERLASEPAQPRWFERPFSFALGPHHVRGRVDRIDELPQGGYELIDYKTGVPKTPAQLREDVQLALYAIGAQRAWQLEPTERSYYYVLDDAKVPVPGGDGGEWISDTVMEVADGILSQGFEPTPSYAACSSCDFRIACPAAER